MEDGSYRYSGVNGASSCDVCPRGILEVDMKLLSVSTNRYSRTNSIDEEEL